MTDSLSMNSIISSGEIIKNHHFDGLTVGTTENFIKAAHEEVHHHNSPTVCFLLNGGGVEKRKLNDYERHACDIKFYHAEELHQSITKVFPSKCVNLEFGEEFLDQYEITETLINSAIAKNQDVKFLMLKIYNEFLINDSLTKDSIKVLLFSIFDDAKSANSRKTPSWIIRLHELLNDRWAETLTLNGLSQELDIHPVTISKHFTKYFSCTLGEYLRKMKINKSISLIKNTELPLTEIALQCGFADQSHFTRNFKKMIGFQPKKLRRF